MEGIKKAFLLLFSIVVFSYSSGQRAVPLKEEKPHKAKDLSGNNFFILISDADISNPENDRRCYYEIYIDKIESGRTSIGLESQQKTFETKLAPNRHLVKIEKWVLDEAQGKYIKLNNILQPKPDYIYIDIKENFIYRVIVESTNNGTTRYNVIVE